MIGKTKKLKNVGSFRLVDVSNLDAARHIFGWQPSVDMVEGVARMFRLAEGKPRAFSVGGGSSFSGNLRR